MNAPSSDIVRGIEKRLRVDERTALKRLLDVLVSNPGLEFSYSEAVLFSEQDAEGAPIIWMPTIPTIGKPMIHAIQ